MFDFIKKVFVPSSNTEGTERKLESPDDLTIGDIVTFHLLPQASLSGKNFQVTAITTYDFKHGRFTTFTLQGETNQPIYLTQCVNEGETYLAIRRKLNRSTVDDLFGLENFASVFDEGTMTTLVPLIKPDTMDGWLGEKYHKEIDCRRGYRHAGDYRNRVLPQYEDESEGCDYYLLLDRSEEFGIEIEVYGDDETDVYVAIYQPLTVIEAMWPGK